jgi:Tol biopolymer transport system component
MNLPWYRPPAPPPTAPAGSAAGRPAPSATPVPTLVIPQPALPVSARRVVTIAQTTGPDLPLGRPISTSRPLRFLTWAPTGDKLLYITNSGEVYWANVDGSDATRVDASDHFMAIIEDQMPLTNTLMMRQRLPQDRTRDHLDVVRFTPGQPPTVEEVFTAPPVQDLHWWRPDRVSGLVNRDYSGGDFLVTLDAHARVVEERNIPYMQTGVVQPGGEWLAYGTRAEVPNGAAMGILPQTIYLLNLRTGRRLQITEPGMGAAVQHWSPDGRWLLIDMLVNDQLLGVLVGADGQEQIHLQLSVGHNTHSGSWSRDGRSLAYSVQGSEADMTRPDGPFASQVFVVDMASRTARKVDSPAVMLPSWAPDNAGLALLTFDPTCAPYPCSGRNPAYYLTHP